MRRIMGMLGMVMMLGVFAAPVLRAADAAAAPAPPAMPDLVDPANLPANAPPLGALDLPGGGKDNASLPDLPADLLGGSSAPEATPTAVPLSKASIKAKAQADKAAEKTAVQAKKASIKATAQAEKESEKDSGRAEKASESSAAAQPTPDESSNTAAQVNPTAEPVPTAVPAEIGASATLPAAGPAVAEGPLTGLEAYFPMRSGRKWNYTSGAGASRSVECTSREQLPGGGVKAVFKMTEGSASAEVPYVLTGGQVVLGADVGGLKKGWILLQAVRRAVVPRWTLNGKDGTAVYYKAEAGSYPDGPKTLLDCITVTERTLKGSSQVSLHKWVYARGVGLVADMVFGATGAPVPAKTYKIVEQTP